VARGRRQTGLDVLLDPLVLFEAVRDDTGRIVDFVYAEANQAACEYNLMSRDELVGSRLLDLLPGHRESGLFAAYVDVVETGRPLSLDGLAYTPEVLGEQRWFDVRAVKVDDGLSYTWRDVTDRIGEVRALREAQAEAARAREAAEITSLSMDAAVIGMAIVSPDLRFRRVNTAFARMLGYTPGQLTTMTFADITHPDDLLRGQDDVARLRRGEVESFHERKRYLTAWGQTLWVDLFVAAARNPDGTMHHHVAQVVDVTAEVVNAAALTRTVDT
jgi:PAS domain S-box-containing protein